MNVEQMMQVLDGVLQGDDKSSYIWGNISRTHTHLLQENVSLIFKKIAEETDNLHAINLEGFMRNAGFGPSITENELTELWMKALDKGGFAALSNLVSMHTKNYEFEKAILLAQQYQSSPNVQMKAHAFFVLGLFYFELNSHISRDIHLAMDNFEKGRALGSVKSVLSLASIYKNGVIDEAGVQIDVEIHKAITYPFHIAG